MSSNFQISYPAIFNGTEKSEVVFLEKNDTILSVFEPGRNNYPRRFFVTDATVASLECMQEFIAKFDDGICNGDLLLILGSGEPYKTIETVLEIIKKAINAGFSRSDLFVGIGGGVVCDITAFAASIFKRGAAVQFVPTTLLAMVDASIGGKTGCDFENYKNMIGTFFPAQKIFYFYDFLKTLPQNQYLSGLAEAFKTAVLYDKDLYEIFKTQSEKIINRDEEVLKVIINKCVHAKAEIVEKDFTEQNIRATLNLGHTFAHALETTVGLGSVTHGQAVAWGIGREIEVCVNKGYCLESFKKEIFSILEKFGWETEPVPAVVRGGGVGERLLNAMHKDKKNIDEKIRLVLTKNICNVVVEEVEDSEILSVLK